MYLTYIFCNSHNNIFGIAAHILMVDRNNCMDIVTPLVLVLVPVLVLVLVLVLAVVLEVVLPAGLVFYLHILYRSPGALQLFQLLG